MRALIIIDVQNDFCPGGNLAVPDGDAVVPIVNKVAGRFDRVVLTQDWHPPGHSSFASSHPDIEPYDTIELGYGEQVLWPDHCVQGTRGAEFHPDLDVTPGQMIVRKGFRKDVDSYSAFYENDHQTPTGLTGYLRERGIDVIYLAGLALDYCVHWSAVDGLKQGFDVVVIEDATRAIDSDGSRDQALRRMRNSGVRFVQSAELDAENGGR
ncbi:MAG: bifunctional nicotinamidase/pyrazinamidase [Bacteroidota bacterium]